MAALMNMHFTQEDNEKVSCLSQLAKERRLLRNRTYNLADQYEKLQPERTVYHIAPYVEEKSLIPELALKKLPYPKLDGKNGIELEQKRICKEINSNILQSLFGGILISLILFLMVKITGITYMLYAGIPIFLITALDVIRWEIVKNIRKTEIHSKVLENEKVNKENQSIILKNKDTARTNALIASQNMGIRKKNEMIKTENEKRKKQQELIVNKQYQEKRKKIFQELLSVKKKMDINGLNMEQLCNELAIDPMYADEVHLEKIRDYMIMKGVSPIRAVKYMEKEREWMDLLDKNYFQMADKIEKTYQETSKKIESYYKDVVQGIYVQRVELEKAICKELKKLAEEEALNNKKMDKIIMQDRSKR